MTQTLVLEGVDFYVEGSGCATMITHVPDANHTNSSLFAVSNTTARNITLAEFWIRKPEFSPAVLMEGAGSRLINFDRVLNMDNSSVGVVLRGLGPSGEWTDASQANDLS